MPKTFQDRALATIKMIPAGKVVTYGQIAAMAGNPRGARMVVRVLHSSSEKQNLPWYRVVNREGRISLPRGGGYELQKARLIDEGVVFDAGDKIDLSRFLWRPER